MVLQYKGEIILSFPLSDGECIHNNSNKTKRIFLFSVEKMQKTTQITSILQETENLCSEYKGLKCLT